MLELGKRQQLKVIRESQSGVYLDAGDGQGVLLPRTEVPEGTREGDRLRVFVYLDSYDQMIATLRHPKASVGEFARLQVKEVNPTGAFLDWGLPKDLFLPYGEQLSKLEAGRWVNVFLYIDNTGRIAATARTDRFLDRDPTGLEVGDLVELMPWRMTDLGMLCIVNQRFEGLIHRQDLTQRLHLGDRMPGYIKQLRPDGRIGLMLQTPGYARVDGLAYSILEDLRENRGFSPVNDKSSPEEIQARYGCSKKAFKMAIGQLLKKDKIEQDSEGLHLNE